MSPRVNRYSEKFCRKAFSFKEQFNLKVMRWFKYHLGDKCARRRQFKSRTSSLATHVI